MPSIGRWPTTTYQNERNICVIVLDLTMYIYFFTQARYKKKILPFFYCFQSDIFEVLPNCAESVVNYLNVLNTVCSIYTSNYMQSNDF